MATNDDSARNAIALFQSLRDIGTNVPNLIALLVTTSIGSSYCLNNQKDVLLKGDTKCGNSRNPLAIASPEYLRALHRLGVQVRVIDAFEQTEFTKNIPGGAQAFWGEALNKIKVWGFTEFDKVLWLDSDQIIQRNMDHLLLTNDEFLVGATGAACNLMEVAQVGGATWSLKPSKERIDMFVDMMNRPLPGEAEWNRGDMHAVTAAFASHWNKQSPKSGWPYTADFNQGYIDKVEYVDAAFAAGKIYNPRTNEPDPVTKGYFPEVEQELRKAGKPLMHFLDPRYEQLIQMCGCNPRFLGMSRASAVEAGFAEPWTSVATQEQERLMRTLKPGSRKRSHVEAELLTRLHEVWPAPVGASMRERMTRPPSAAYNQWYGAPVHPPAYDHDQGRAIPGYLRAIGCDPSLPVPCGKGRPVAEPLTPLQGFIDAAQARRGNGTQADSGKGTDAPDKRDESPRGLRGRPTAVGGRQLGSDKALQCHGGDMPVVAAGSMASMAALSRKARSLSSGAAGTQERNRLGRSLSGKGVESLYESQVMARIPVLPRDDDQELRRGWRAVEGPTGYDDGSFSLHYTTIGTKPSQVKNQEEFQQVFEGILEKKPCLREMFALWYSKFFRGMGGEEARIAGDPDAEVFRYEGGTTMAGPAFTKE